MATIDRSATPIPYRQIRAYYDDKTITVYQAYSESIATAAVASQNLTASPDFSYDRMTWIKPSWCWMLYRSGYSLKDSRQSRILALKMTHENFLNLLRQAAVCRNEALTNEEKARKVRVQWDPERSPRLGALGYRSIQIGIGRGLSGKWAEEWVEGIEDVTERALRFKEVVEGDREVGVEDLVERGLMPVERVYEVPKELRELLGMGEGMERD
ncbi:hypothetical protein G7Y89_g4953 [Cudoniella acicularis]|uniref:ATP-dependent RNA helicase DHX8 n=1 Tax=Cudoniella acicularis TaxID=354080 RepID=A0A8H4RQM5_9HELO|nr:hypothetical protein G7Y89_g4953 [Cudoniella acicularis]